MKVNYKLIVKILIYILAALLLFFNKKVFAAYVKTLSHQYNLVYANFLIKKIEKLPKNTPVVIYLKDDSIISGIYKGYVRYDNTLFIKVYGDWLETGYDINEIQDVVVQSK